MRRLIPLAAVATTVLAAVLVLSGGGDGGPPGVAPARTAEAGEVEVTATPLGGGDYRVAFDTHTVGLDFDPAEVAVLETPGGALRATAWDGAGPGGHHREGTLRFDVDADVDEAALVVTLDERVVLDWRAG